MKAMATDEVLAQVRGQVGFITLNRPAALNALSLSMIRRLTQCLLARRDDDRWRIALRCVSRRHRAREHRSQRRHQGGNAKHEGSRQHGVSTRNSIFWTRQVPSSALVRVARVLFVATPTVRLTPVWATRVP